MLREPTFFIKNAYAMHRFIGAMSFHLPAMNENDENARQGHVFTNCSSHDVLYILSYCLTQKYNSLSFRIN